MTGLMWSAAGIVRHTRELRSALDQLRDMYIDVRALREEIGVAPELQELLNLVTGEKPEPILVTQALSFVVICSLRWEMWDAMQERLCRLLDVLQGLAVECGQSVVCLPFQCLKEASCPARFQNDFRAAW